MGKIEGILTRLYYEMDLDGRMEKQGKGLMDKGLEVVWKRGEMVRVFYEYT